MIPMTMRLKARERHDGTWTGINLWLPLFIIWILLLPVIIIIFAAWVLLRILGLTLAGPRRAARIIEAGLGVLVKINGLRVEVRSRDNRFILHF